MVVVLDQLECWAGCLVSVQARELRSSLIIETTFSEPVKAQKSNIKSCHFVENMLKYKIDEYFEKVSPYFH